MAVFDARFVKPLPQDQLAELAASQPFMLTVEENILAGGFGSAVLECLADKGVLGSLRFRRLGIPDRFVEHGSQNALRASLGLDRAGIIRVLRELAGGTEGPGEA